MHLRVGQLRSAERSARPFGIALIIVGALWEVIVKLAEHAILGFATDHLESTGLGKQIVEFAVEHPFSVLGVFAGCYLLLVLVAAARVPEASEHREPILPATQKTTLTGGAGSNNPATAIGQVTGPVNIGGEFHEHYHYPAREAAGSNVPWALSTSGNGNNSVDLGLVPNRVSLDKLGISFELQQLPQSIDVAGNSVTFSFQNERLIVNDHGVKGIALEGHVYGTRVRNQVPAEAVPVRETKRPKVMVLSYTTFIKMKQEYEGLHLHNEGDAVAYQITVEPLHLGEWSVHFADLPLLKDDGYVRAVSFLTAQVLEGGVIASRTTQTLDTAWRNAQQEADFENGQIQMSYRDFEGTVYHVSCTIERDQMIRDALPFRIRNCKSD